MKLYTEEQMAKVWMAGQKYWETSGASITFEELLEHENPIELPSDRDIEIAANGNQEHYEGAMWLKYKYLTKTNNL